MKQVRSSTTRHRADGAQREGGSLLRHIALLGLLGLVALAHVAAQEGPGWDVRLRRYPYLTDLSGPYVTINWATDRSMMQAVATWGRAGGSCTANKVAATRSPFLVNGVPLYQWKANLTLAPDRAYCYRVFLGANREIDLLGSDPSPQFRTQVPAGATTPFTFAVFGDWGQVNEFGQNEAQARLLAHLAASRARFALTTGDNAYPAGSHTNYGDLVQQGPGMSAVFGPAFWKVSGTSIALFPALGNHDLRSDAFHPYLINWPQDRTVAASGGRYAKEVYCCQNGTLSATYPSAWYAFDVGNARFYVLHAAWSDSNLGAGSEYANDYAYHWTPTSDQYLWLKQDLEQHRAALKFAFFHYPLASDDSTEPSDPFLAGEHSLEGLLRRAGVAIAFTGHAHIYQRNDKSDVGALVSYVTGGGGGRLVPIGGRGCSPLDAYGIGWSYGSEESPGRGSACGAAQPPTSLAEVFHLLLVHVNGMEVTVEPINSVGQSFDIQRYDFGAPVDTTAPTTPPALAARPDHQGVALAWGAASDDMGVRGYTIYRDDVVIAAVSPTQLAYRDETVNPETTYQYQIDAFDAQGNHSPRSAPVTIMTTGPDKTPPSAPTNLRATFSFSTGVELRWDAATDEGGVAGYIIRRNGLTLAQVASDATSYSDDTVAGGATYRYTLVAIDNADNVSPVASATVKVPSRVLLPFVVREENRR